MRVGAAGTLVIAGLLSCGTAWAQDAETAEPEAIEEAPPVEDPAASDVSEETAETSAAPMPATESSEQSDGPRFRFGISGGAGFMTGVGSALVYGGGDLRLGAQINDLIGVYVQPQLGYYTTSGATAGGGLAGASAVVDVTLIDRFFVGAGLGYAVLNNPSGPELHFRLGGYPLVSKDPDSGRRKGLMLGADIRFHFLDGATITAPTFSIGYEAF